MRKKILAIASTLLMVMGLVSLGAGPASADGAEPDGASVAAQSVGGTQGPDADKKVWVCKVVGNVGAYRLKDGRQPIHVSVNSTDATTANPIGAAFNDAHPSFVVAADDLQLCLDGLPVPPVLPVQCVVTSSTVHGSLANFTVGPLGCTLPTPPVSFSTYSLPGGHIQPFADQVAFAHATNNGQTYTAGNYELTAQLPECNWQSDLYFPQNGVTNQPSAPHVHPISGMNIGWDYVEGQTCAITPPTVATLVPPTVADMCGTASDGTSPVYPAGSTGVTWKLGSVTHMPNGDIRYRVVATALPNFVIPAPSATDTYELVDGKAVWKLYTTNVQCPPTVLQCTSVTAGPVSTNLNPNGWYFTDSKSEGHHAYVPGGLHIWTDSNSGDAKSAGMIDTNIPLAEIGNPALNYTNTSGQAEPGINLELTVDGVRIGVLTFEPLFDYWWTGHVIAGMPSKTIDHTYQKAFGSLDDFLAAYAANGAKDVMITGVGFSLGSGALGNGTINSITAGCVNYTFDYKTITVLPEVPTASDVCGTSNDVVNVPKNTADIRYTVKDERVNGVGTVTVKASPNTDRVIPKGTQRLFTFTFTDAPCPIAVTPADPTAQNEVCVAGNRTSGSIWVDLKVGVVYTIDGTAVTKATTLVEPGDHVVTATAAEGYVLEGDTVWPYTVTVKRAENCGFQFPDLSVVTPHVTSNNLTCKAAGSFTLGEADGIADAIIWKVDGNPVAAGTHAVTKKGTHVVTAVPGEGHGFASGIENPSTWTLSFTDPMDCGDLTTLALPGESLAATGTDGGAVNLGLLFASGLLFLGGALVITEKRFRFGKK